jgi:hypothetical protein
MSQYSFQLRLNDRMVRKRVEKLTDLLNLLARLILMLCMQLE